ncbi:MAG: HAD-IB family hydrolase [Candidatus Doudnabacteria bacterium CG10_big_fil_rev_8_21_14_0_10_42_18]|uniref:HAD-IB family hydrolase n=1 Tax=Candidatus Doudnabacteria bacterium CG10_big_fil_rev_8_21_14_0_10_42_18 TaxID=1974552 RepID=A0A2H0VE76_9BACT|nr:MAG: HAD-IB family hydrolase [Candidatus Doudnabacteria bacterium CG10_big_fil_rev_8_21_14_0_10_42_18]
MDKHRKQNSTLTPALSRLRRGKVKFAIFDIDGTIFRSSLVIELMRSLVKHRIFPKAADKEAQKEYLAWLDRKGSYGDYINKVVKIYIKYIAGKSSRNVYRVAKEVVKYQKDRTYRYTRDLIKQLKKQGYFLVAISGSPIYIVEEYAKAVGFNVWFGTEIEVKGGKFTGKVLNLDSAFKKDKVLFNYLKQRNMAVDWEKSVAVGDTETDVSILGRVGRSIAFNPNRQLAEIAKRKKWEIVVERKDVAYGIDDFRFMI